MSCLTRSKVIWALTCLCLASCGRDLPRVDDAPAAARDAGTPTPDPSEVVGLLVTPTKISVEAGTTVQLEVLGVRRDGTRVAITSADSGTLYESSAPNVATVSPDGLIRAVRSGEAAVTVRYETLGAEVQVEVQPTATLVGIVISAAPGVRIGVRTAFSVIGRYSDGASADFTLDPRLTVTVDRPEVLRVEGGVMVGLTPGQAIVRARFDDRSLGVFTAEAAIWVDVGEDPIVSIEFRPSTLTLSLNESAIVVLLGITRSGSVFDLTGSSDVLYGATGPLGFQAAPGALTVTARGTGRGVLEAQYFGLTAALPVVIEGAASVTGILIVVQATLRLGDSVSYQVLAVTSDGMREDVTLAPELSITSSRPQVGELTPGRITALAPGFTEIDAEYMGFTASATVRVIGMPDPIVALSWQPASLVMRQGDQPLVQLIATNASGVQMNVSLDPATTVRVQFGQINFNAVSGGFVVNALGLGQAFVSASYGSFDALLVIEVQP